MKKETSSTRRHLLGLSIVLSVIFVGTIFNSGCNSKSGSGSKTEGGKSGEEFEDEKVVPPKKTAEDFLESDRDSMVGHWLVRAFPLQGGEQQVYSQFAWFILNIERDSDGKYIAKVASQKAYETITVNSSSITDSTLKLELLSKLEPPTKTKQKTEIPTSVITLEGERKKNIIRSKVVAVPAAPLMLAEFSAVSKFDLSEIDIATPHKNLQSFGKIATVFEKQKDSRVFKEFLFSFEDSPLAFLAVKQILQRLKVNKYKEAETKEVGDQYIKFASLWSTENRLEALRDICVSLNGHRYHPELLMRYIEQFEKELLLAKEQLTEVVFERNHQLSKDLMKDAIAWRNIKRVNLGQPAERVQAAKELAITLKEKPFHPLVLFALATNARKENDLDAAIDYYCQLSVVPALKAILTSFWRVDGLGSLPRVDEILARVWVQKHGSPDGLEAHKQKIYEKSIYSFAEAPKTSPPNKDQRNMLLELFTSTEFPACLAADIAMGSLSRTYPGEELTVLRYHQHTGGGNPLANQDSEARVTYYGNLQAPSVLQNGKLIINRQAPTVFAADFYKEIKTQIEEELKETSKIRIALEAKKTEDKLAVDVIAGGDVIKGDWRLVVVLAEGRVDYKGANDLRFHEMVVRKVLTSIEGNPAQSGKLEFHRKYLVNEIAGDLRASLDIYEKEFQHEFIDKPLEMKNLHIVAFVQNKKTKEVLQVARVKVTEAANTKATPAKKSKKK